MSTLPAAALRNAALALLLTVSAAGASPSECTCHNLESLQQDYQNAVYLERYMREVAEHLRALEDRLTEAKKDPTNPDADVDIISTANNARKAYDEQHLRLPFKVAGYTGPDSVEMPYGSCQQPQNVLDAMENGSPCKGMADAALDHERRHRDLCNQLGQANYWGRPRSEIALEEADAYHQQAADLKAELQRVLEASKVEYKGEVIVRVTVPGAMETAYRFVTRSDDLSSTSSGETWDMTGQGTVVTTIDSAVIGGMKCTPSGSVNGEFGTTLKTDGLTFGLEVKGGVTGGSPAISCPGGMGMGFPPPDPISGRLASGLPLKEGDNVITGDFSGPMQAIMAGMGSVTHEGDLVLSVTCSAE